MDFKQIANAWIIAHNPSKLQLKLAEERSKICDECPSKKTITTKLKIGVVCNECGCPISKKIFTDDYNPCPLKKWGEVDETYIPQKKKSTLI